MEVPEVVVEQQSTIGSLISDYGFPIIAAFAMAYFCLLYTSPSPRDRG